MNNNTLHTKLSYTSTNNENVDLTYFNGASVENARNTLMIFEIKNTYQYETVENHTVNNVQHLANVSHKNESTTYGLYWINDKGIANLVNVPTDIKLTAEIKHNITN